MKKECQHCGSGDLCFTDTAANGGYGPSFLPGTGFLKPAKFRIIVCEQCGFTRWFVVPGDLGKVKNSKHFRRLR
ncbi:MAG TPA: hypothetical protein GX528_08150 [Firmicutes bacterium]|nr:hypothetical protein [Bacillota bacterium]